MKKDEKRYPLVRNLGILMAIPMVFIAGPLAGFLIGSWVDRKWGTDPWGLTILVLLGFVASVKQVIDFLKRATRENNSE